MPSKKTPATKPFEAKADTCPHCGACQHCGHGGKTVPNPYPVVPWTQPWPQPYRPYVQPNGTARPYIYYSSTSGGNYA